ncbi:elongation factor 4, partial [Elusimicrobiota bacterium]
EIDNPAKFPLYSEILEIQEPYVAATIICPSDYMGPVLDLCQKKRGTQKSMKYITEKIVVLKYEIP